MPFNPFWSGKRAQRAPARAIIGSGIKLRGQRLEASPQPAPYGSGSFTGTSSGSNTGDQTTLGATAPIRLMGYTVATLPAGAVGDIAYVTDALAPTFLAIVVGGGAVKTPVFFNGANWIGF